MLYVVKKHCPEDWGSQLE